MMQKACSFFGFATCALATLSMKRHGGARIFTGGIPKVYQYRWALRHPVVKEAITRAMGNRYPSR
jgi:hypothetical protein